MEQLAVLKRWIDANCEKLFTFSPLDIDKISLRTLIRAVSRQNSLSFFEEVDSQDLSLRSRSVFFFSKKKLKRRGEDSFRSFLNPPLLSMIIAY